MLQRTIAIVVLGLLASTAGAAGPSPNGITLPEAYRNWRLIAPSYRADKNQIRAILGNDIAIEAARKGQNHPWPDGAILAKLAWKQKTDEHFPAAIGPGEFAQAEFMIKDAT
jgi:hypothetical protein